MVNIFVMLLCPDLTTIEYKGDCLVLVKCILAAAVHSKVIVLLLSIHCLMFFQLLVGVIVLLCITKFCNNLDKKREIAVLL